MSTLDADILATLTPEEQEAIQEDEYTADEVSTLKTLASGDESDDADEDDDEEVDSPPIEGRAPPKEEPAAREQPEPDINEMQPPPKPIYTAQVPADIAQKLAALESADDDIQTKYDNGEIDHAEAKARRAELRLQRDELTIAKAKAEISQEMQAQAAQSAWETNVNAFLDSVAASVDYRKDADKAADLDEFVKKLAMNPAHDGKPMGWFLSEAHKRVQALHGLPMDAPKAQPAKPSRSRTPMDDAPRTLAHVPGGDGPGDVGDEFADILALDGYALEDALARMTPAQRERFART
jgi:hypothetical protein